MNEEHPLQTLRPLIHPISLIGPAKDVLSIIVLLQVKQNSRSLKDAKVPPVGIFQRRNAPIRVDSKEPIFLLLILAEGDGNVFDLKLARIGGFEFFGKVGAFLTVGSAGGVEDDWLHCCAWSRWGVCGGEGKGTRRGVPAM